MKQVHSSRSSSVPAGHVPAHSSVGAGAGEVVQQQSGNWISTSPVMVAQREKINGIFGAKAPEPVNGIFGQQPVQRLILRNGKNGFKSTYPELAGKVYAERGDAETAEREVEVQREQARAEHVRPQFELTPHTGEIPQPENDFAEQLLQHRGQFGPLLTTGGFIYSDQFNKATGRQVENDDNHRMFAGSNTYSGVFSGTSYGGGGFSYNAHNRQGGFTPLDDITDETHKPEDFHKSYIFSQGKADDDVHFPGTRTEGHSEAQAVHSNAFTEAMDNNADDMEEMMMICDAMDESEGFHIDEEPTDEQIEQLCNFLSMPINTETLTAINRASCRTNKHHKKGCIDEMSEASKKYDTHMQERLGTQAAFLSKATGKTSFASSVGGGYADEGNPKTMTDSGVSLRMHNPLNWNTGVQRPVDGQYQSWANQSMQESQESGSFYRMQPSQVIDIATWQEASYRAFRRGQRIRITNHQYDISDRIFELKEDYDPSQMEYPEINGFVRRVV
jgi:hypothetical protein